MIYEKNFGTINFRKLLNSNKILLKGKGRSSQTKAASIFYEQVFHQYYKKFKFKKNLGSPSVTSEDILKRFIFHLSVLTRLEKLMNVLKSFISKK